MGLHKKRTKKGLLVDFFCLASEAFCVRKRGTDSPRFRDIAWPLESDGWALDSWRAFDQWAPHRWQQDTCFPSKRRGPGSSGVDIQLSALINPVLHWSLIFYLHAGFRVSQKEQELTVDNLYSLLTVSLVFVLNGIHHKKAAVKKVFFYDNVLTLIQQATHSESSDLPLS